MMVETVVESRKEPMQVIFITLYPTTESGGGDKPLEVNYCERLFCECGNAFQSVLVVIGYKKQTMLQER